MTTTMAARSNRAQVRLITLVGVLTTASALFRLGFGSGLTAEAPDSNKPRPCSSGMPALLATAAVFIPARSAMGVACKSVTIGLLISLIFLGEGMLCVLMTAPLFYLVALFVGALIDMSRRDDSRHNILSCLAALSLVPMSLEGVMPITTIARSTVVSETRIVHAPAEAVGGGTTRAAPVRSAAAGAPREKLPASDRHARRRRTRFASPCVAAR